jgi:hypothetical protein
MSVASKFRALFGSAVCISIGLGSVISPAIAQDRSVWLQEGQSATISGYLLEGENVYAVCDEDCSDLDMFLYDEMDTLVDADEQPDAFPIVTAPYDGTFSIFVSMPSCGHESGCSASVSSDNGF